MQHPDEGTIHSWLDGALTPDESARVEAHVAECAQCAAAVAEARGFIAASSRILTALDNAPRGVIPVAAPRKRIEPLVWRIAATLLVVAGGTLVVVRNRGADEQLTSSKTDPVSFSSEQDAATRQTAAETAPVPGAADQALPRASKSEAPSIAGPKVSAERVNAGARAAAGRVARAPEAVHAPASAAPTFAPSKVAATAAMDAAADPQLLKVVGSPRRIGAKVTLYEVAPGDTVTLTESVPAELTEILPRGSTSLSVPSAQNAREKSVAAPPKSRSEVTATSSHTITWTDSTTRSTLSLTGRMPEARLQEIRIRIEGERAAAAKKEP